MKDYVVHWEIDLWAETPEDAAREALKIMQDKTSTATVFVVSDGVDVTTVDLEETKK